MERWQYLIHPMSDYDKIKPNELFYDDINNILFIKKENEYNIPLITNLLEGHVKRTDNPHMLTKDDVGLSKIPNKRLLNIDALNNHIKNNKAHEPKVEDIKLELVENFKVATQKDIDDRADDKYMTAAQLKAELDKILEDKIDKSKIRISSTSNAENHLLSLRLTSSDKWTDGNNQTILKGEYEYKVISPGYYSKKGTIFLNKDRNLHFDLDKVSSVPYDKSVLSSSLGFATAIHRNGELSVWGEDVFNGVSGYTNQGKSIRSSFLHTDLYTNIYDDGSIYHWGIGSYPFLQKIDRSKRYISFVMNNDGCALIDEDGNLHIYDKTSKHTRNNSTKFKSLYANKSIFIGLTENGLINAWGEDINNIITSTPIGSYKHISMSNTDIVGLTTNHVLNKWGTDDLLKGVDIQNIKDVRDVSIQGDSIAYINYGGELKVRGSIASVLKPEVFKTTYSMVKLLTSKSIMLTKSSGELVIYPASTSLIYTSKPQGNNFI